MNVDNLGGTGAEAFLTGHVTPEMPRRGFSSIGLGWWRKPGHRCHRENDGQITCFVHTDCRCWQRIHRFSGTRFWQSNKWQIGPWMKCHVTLIRGLPHLSSPLNLTENFANGLWADCDISLWCAGNNFDFGCVETG